MPSHTCSWRAATIALIFAVILFSVSATSFNVQLFNDK